MLLRLQDAVASHLPQLNLVHIVVMYVLSPKKTRKPKYIGAYGTLEENVAITNYQDQNKALYGAALYGRWGICDKLVACGASPYEGLGAICRRGDIEQFIRWKKRYCPSFHFPCLIEIARGGNIAFAQYFGKAEKWDMEKCCLTFLNGAIWSANAGFMKFLASVDPGFFSRSPVLTWSSEFYRLFRKGSLNPIKKVFTLLRLDKCVLKIDDFRLMLHQAARGGSVSVFEHVFHWALSIHGKFMSSLKHQTLLLQPVCESGNIEMLDAFSRCCQVSVDDIFAESCLDVLTGCMASGNVAMMTWGLDQASPHHLVPFSDGSLEIDPPIKYAVRSLCLPICLRFFTMLTQRFSSAQSRQESWSDVEIAMRFLVAACEIGSIAFFEQLRKALLPLETVWKEKTIFIQVALENGYTAIAEHLLNTQFDGRLPLEKFDNIVSRSHPSVRRFLLTYAIRIQKMCRNQFASFQAACLSVIRRPWYKMISSNRLDAFNCLLCIVGLNRKGVEDMTFLRSTTVLHCAECLLIPSEFHVCTCKPISAYHRKNRRNDTSLPLRRSKRLKTTKK